MSKEAFLKRRVQSVEVYGETFYVRPLTGSQVEDLLTIGDDESLDGIKALSRIACSCACDESGNRIWSDDDIDQIRENADLAVVKAVAEKAIDISGLGDKSGND